MKCHSQAPFCYLKERRFSETNRFPFGGGGREGRSPKENVYPFSVAKVLEHEMLSMECGP